MAHSISVIMLVDELIANLLNIHNRQFLLSDNELSQSKGLQTLVWHDFIGCFLSSPQNQIPPSFYPWHRHWGGGQGWGKCSGVDGQNKPLVWTPSASFEPKALLQCPGFGKLVWRTHFSRFYFILNSFYASTALWKWKMEWLQIIFTNGSFSHRKPCYSKSRSGDQQHQRHPGAR